MNLKVYSKEFGYNLKLAYPVILGMLGHTLTGIVDNIMVGRIGSTELAAVSLGNSMIFIAMSIGIGFSTSITPLVAEADAQGDTTRIRSIFQNGMFLCTVLGALLFLVIVAAKPLMIYLQQPEEVITLALPYLDYVAFSLIPLIMYQGYKQFADGLSLTKYAMWAIVMANVVNVALNYLLIHGIWIFPEMGMLGAGLGTVISRILMVVFMHLILFNNHKIRAFFQEFHLREIKKVMMVRIASLGFPSAMQMLFEMGLFTSAIWLSGNIGPESQAANQIALTLATVTFMFAMGLSVAATIRVGNQKGRGDFKQLLIVARSLFILVLLIEILFAFLFIALHQFLPQFFLNMENPEQILTNTEVIAIAAKLLIVAAIFQISDGIQVVVLGALRGLQDVKVPMYITFVAYWIIGFPISFVLGLYTDLKAVGVWIGLLAGLTAAGLFLYIRFEKLTRRLIVQKSQSEPYGTS
ncbi:MAG: MATE family efflux transporter [Flavobacterium sp.]|nr:MATE family efflux transporter [Flavobacterium sp.]